jgi:hypothetical protein
MQQFHLLRMLISYFMASEYRYMQYALIKFIQNEMTYRAVEWLFAIYF